MPNSKRCRLKKLTFTEKNCSFKWERNRSQITALRYLSRKTSKIHDEKFKNWICITVAIKVNMLWCWYLQFVLPRTIVESQFSELISAQVIHYFQFVQVLKTYPGNNYKLHISVLIRFKQLNYPRKDCICVNRSIRNLSIFKTIRATDYRSKQQQCVS